MSEGVWSDPSERVRVLERLRALIDKVQEEAVGEPGDDE